MDASLLLLAGAAFSVSGIVLLHAASLARRAGAQARRRKLVSSAWLLVAFAFLPWMYARGFDKGAAFAVIVCMLAGVMLVLRAGLLHEGNGRGRAEREARAADANGAHGLPLFLRRSWVFLLAGPLAGTASLLLAAVLFAAWDVASGSAANRLAAVMLFVPLAWALLATFATYNARLRYRSLIVCAFLVAGLAGAFLPELA